jgi:hypothetical protein
MLAEQPGGPLVKSVIIRAALALALLAPAAALGWGPNGHRITAAVAEARLAPETRAAARGLLGGRSLAHRATWPDEVRSDPSWNCAAPFHFVTIPPGAPYPGAQAVAEGDAFQALVYYTDQLRDPYAGAEAKRIALIYVVHIVGDMHQPLHNGLGCDRGGNAVGVTFFDAPMNLHTVWDEAMIEQEGLSYSEFAGFLLEGPEPAAGSASPVDWVRESQAHLPGAYSCDVGKEGDGCACYAGDCADGLSAFAGCGTLIEALAPETLGVAPKLGYKYLFRNLPVARERLRLGGLRLAAHLDWALDPDAAPPVAYAAAAARVRSLPGWSGAPASCMGATRP